MTATELVEVLRARGVTLEARGDRLRVAPVSRLTRQELDRLRAAKAEVLALLTDTPRHVGPASAASPAPTHPTTGLDPTQPPGQALGPSLPQGYAFPWPDRIPDLGARRVQAFDVCADCGAGSWVAYGARVCCLACARLREMPQETLAREVNRHD